MDYKKLKIHQKDLLNLYESLCEILEKEGREIDSGLKTTRDNVEAGRFLFAIFGEVRSGKSTFINALLKEAILPSDDLQATSEIIEVCKSNKKKAEVTFVNRSRQVVEDEVARSLKEIASVNEVYRSIPITQVNRFLSDHYSKEEGKAVFDEEELETFLSSDLENTHRLKAKKFKGKIREYIDQNISCDKIPSEVSLYYPHDISEFKHFRIVDTPGVNAIGGIEERTEEFIDRADAVICLCNARQLESRTLRNILENDLPKDVKKHLILILTHRSDYPSNEQRKRILDQANNVLTVGSKNIFFLDSLTELDLQKFYGAKTIDEIYAIRATDEELRGRTARFYEEAGGNRNKFLNLLESQANFRGIRERIREDARKSAAIQMRDFADAMQRKYGKLDERIKARIAPLKKKYRDPRFFASKKQNQKDEMERMERDYKEFKNTLKAKFSPRDEKSGYSQEMNQIVKKFLNKIRVEEFDPNESDAPKAKSVQDYLEKLNQSWIYKISKFIDKLETDYQHEIDRNVELKSDYSITVPEIDLGSIWDAAFNATQSEINEKLAQVDRERSAMRRVWDTLTKGYGATENKKNEIWRSFPILFWKKIQPELEACYEAAKTELSRQIDEMINELCDAYKHEFDRKFMKEKQCMEDIKTDEKENEELNNKILCLKKQRKEINDNISECIRVGSQL